MGRKMEKTKTIGSANFGRFFAVWEVGTPYIEVYSTATGEMGFSQAKAAAQRGESYPGSIHIIGTNGDLLVSGMPKRGRTPDEYVREELERFANEDGGAYLGAMDEGYGR